jgi:uncharacterized protein YuzE
MRVRYESSTDVAFIYFVPQIEPGDVQKTYAILPGEIDGMVNLDFSADGVLLGLEISSARKRLSAISESSGDSLELEVGFDYDKKSDSASFHFGRFPPASLRQVHHCSAVPVTISFDAQGKLVSLDVMQASKHLSTLSS